MRKLLPLALMVAIASGCNNTPETTTVVPQETPTPSETTEATTTDTADVTPTPDIAIVNFAVEVTTGIYAEPDANVTGLNGSYQYNPTTNALESIFFFDQAKNDISEYCQDMTLNSDGIGLNGKCVLPGGEYAFGEAVTEANAPEQYPFSYLFDAGPGGEGVGVVNYEPPVTVPEAAASYPEVATIQKIVQGDSMCYVTLTDTTGQEYDVGASFEICEQQDTLLNREVNLRYEVTSIQDCQSIEPCGRSRLERIIVAAE
ncbi:MAG: hypothetical protein SAJ12_02515 [Jaaginema sp. PMC 1079.18]|nr:hypothetical protein [Jaaginema sp. PMC 1080.18]MEC4849863.1 hypothetical protein [Jaaginema sp. PMC 1079.18]